MASIKLKGDTSGEVIISAPSVAGNTTLELPATSSTLATQNSLGLRNLIINGDMQIDQRNAGASNTSSSTTYMVDRFQFQMSSVANVQTYQQVTDAPAGFNKSLKITNNSTTQSTAAGVLATPRQKIEGFNTAHLNWGTADAQTVTVSFWVKASVTGTYPVALTNNDFTRSFVTNYTVSVANTWEKKTVTITGDTSGTWSINNSTGITVMFSLDTGSSYQTTADSWQTGSYRGTSSNVHFLANASATWQITGVQVEVNTTATPFENLMYSQQLAMCQRYYIKITDPAACGVAAGGNSARNSIFLPVTMRANPSVLASGTFNFYNGAATRTGTVVGYYPGISAQVVQLDFTLSSGFTTSQAVTLFTNNGNQFISSSAEL